MLTICDFDGLRDSLIKNEAIPNLLGVHAWVIADSRSI